MNEDCPRKIQVGEKDWTEADQELEDWLRARGFDCTSCVDNRKRAKSEEEWQQYVQNVKEYALKCKSWKEFVDLREHFTLLRKGKGHDIRDKNGKLRIIVD